MQFLTTQQNKRIAYHLSEGVLPCVIFCGGFKSDMTGSKATALEAACIARGQRFIRFDYTGHGKSSGEFRDGTISQWLSDALDVIDNLGAEKNILVGSSMGAWISVLAACARPEKIVALVGVASAPDFTEKLIWEKLPAQEQKKLLEEGVYYAPSCYGEEPYPIMRALIEDGRKHLLLDGEIKLDIPVRLLHGTKDADVPFDISQRLMECITSKDVRLTLVKDGDHRLSNPEQLALLCETVVSVISSQKSFASGKI